MWDWDGNKNRVGGWMYTMGVIRFFCLDVFVQFTCIFPFVWASALVYWYTLPCLFFLSYFQFPLGGRVKTRESERVSCTRNTGATPATATAGGEGLFTR